MATRNSARPVAPAATPIDEASVRAFWNAHPYGDRIVGGLHLVFEDDYERFFAANYAWRYRQEAHIAARLDRTDLWVTPVAGRRGDAQH